MGKLSRAKRNEMFNEYCLHSECGQYMEFLERRVSELEFELSKYKIKEITENPVGYLARLADSCLPIIKEKEDDR